MGPPLSVTSNLVTGCDWICHMDAAISAPITPIITFSPLVLGSVHYIQSVARYHYYYMIMIVLIIIIINPCVHAWYSICRASSALSTPIIPVTAIYPSVWSWQNLLHGLSIIKASNLYHCHLSLSLCMILFDFINRHTVFVIKSFAYNKHSKPEPGIITSAMLSIELSTNIWSRCACL
jgi:hypothetical protein